MENVCEYCGQVIFGDFCDCFAGQKKRRRAIQASEARQAVLDIFGIDDPDHGFKKLSDEDIVLLQKLTDRCAVLGLRSASLLFYGGTKASITSSHGKIKVVRSETRKNTQEIEE